MELLNLSTEWAESEVFSTKFFILFAILFFIASLGFWQLGKTDLAKAYIIPTFVAAILLLIIGLGLLYSGFLMGNTIIITSSFSHEHHDITSYCIQVILKTLLGALIIPVFRAGITYIFKIKTLENGPKEEADYLGHGIYEGAVFLTCAFLTSIIIGQIHFGTIYPFF